MKPRQSYIGLLVIAAIVFGRGLHLCVSPEFWGTEPLAFRLEALLRLVIGAAIYYLAGRLKPAD